MRRRKSFKSKLILLLTSLMGLVSLGAYASFVTISSSSKDAVSEEMSPIAVAKNVTQGITYYTIHQALNNTKSGDVVAILPDTNATLYKNATVQSGVTLTIPLAMTDDGEMSNDGSSNKSSSTTKTLDSFTEVNKMSIKEGITLTVKGTLDIYGILSGGEGGAPSSSHTSDRCSAIYMGSNSTIRVEGGNVNCRGYIYETSLEGKNNGSKIELIGGNILLPAVMRDFKGGSVLKFYYENKDKQVIPFDQLMFPNIRPLLRIDNESNITGVINLYAGGMHSSATQIMVGGDSSAYMQLMDHNAYFEAKYNYQKEENYMWFYGNVKMNSLIFEINALFINATVNSSEYFYTISWRFKMEFLPGKNGVANVDIPNKIIALPGSYIKVHTNVTLNFGNEVSIIDYEPFGEDKNYYDDTVYNGPQITAKYCDSIFFANNENDGTEEEPFIRARFINNGIVNAYALAGRVECEKQGAILKVNGCSVSTNHLSQYNLDNGLFYDTLIDVVWDEINNTLRGENEEGVYIDLEETGTYISNQDSRWELNNESTSGSISINAQEITLYEGESATLTITSDGTYDVFSAVEEVVSIESIESETVTIKAISPGESAIIAQCGSNFATCNVIVLGIDTVEFVNSSDQVISSIEFDEGSENVSAVMVESTDKVTFDIKESSLSNDKELTMSNINSNETLNEDGSYTYVLDIEIPDICTGTAILQATCNNATAELLINVKSVNTISLTSETNSITIGNTTTVTASVEGIERQPGCSWSSSNVGVATVTVNQENEFEAVVTGVSAGTVSITCTYGSVSDSISITVKAEDSGGSGGGGACVLENTLITLFDGSEKKVQDLQAGDRLLSYDHLKGEFISAPLLLNAHAEEKMRYVDVLTLYFSNNKSIRIAYNHGFYNVNRNKYVTIDNDNVEQFKGESFYFYEDESAVLSDYDIDNEYVKVYAPVTKDNFNCVTNGLISVPGVASDFLLSVYEYDDQMKINQIQLQNDIALYGLFDYEDLSMYVSKEMFETLKLSYVKIGIGKGIYTMDDVIKYLNLYKKYFE